MERVQGRILLVLTADVFFNDDPAGGMGAMLFGWAARQTIGRGGGRGDAWELFDTWDLARCAGDGAAECCRDFFFFFFLSTMRGFALPAAEARNGPTRYGGHATTVDSYLPLPLPLPLPRTLRYVFFYRVGCELDCGLCWVLLVLAVAR